MVRLKFVMLILCAAAAAGAFLLFAPVSQAQQNCTEFRAVIQGILPSPFPLAADGSDVWGGRIYGTLGGEPLIGIMAGNDGSETQHGGKAGRYQVYLCNPLTPHALEFPPACPDSISYEVANSVFGFVPGKAGLGNYKGNTAKIISGSGRFSGASGNLNISGPYILWSDPASPFFGTYGRWNGEVSGSICPAR